MIIKFLSSTLFNTNSFKNQLIQNSNYVLKLQLTLDYSHFFLNLFRPLGLTLRLLLNLSFHTKLRADVHEVKMTQKLVKLLKTDEHRISALCLLYQLSYDEKHRAVYAFVPELIEHIVAELLKPKNGTEPEPTATALLVNLCSNVACVGQVCKMHNGKVVKALAKRAFRQKSVLLMKMVRNMSQFDSAKDHLMNYIGELAQAIGSSLGKCYQKFMEDDAPKSRLNERMANLEELEEVEAFALECVGTLANVTNADLDYNMIIDEYRLVLQKFHGNSNCQK